MLRHKLKQAVLPGSEEDERQSPGVGLSPGFGIRQIGAGRLAVLPVGPWESALASLGLSILARKMEN